VVLSAQRTFTLEYCFVFWVFGWWTSAPNSTITAVYHHWHVYVMMWRLSFAQGLCSV